MKSLNIPLFCIGISIICGIVLRFYFPINPVVSYGIFGVLFLAFVYTYIRAKNRLFQDKAFTITTIILCVGFGYFLTYFQQPQQHQDHYLHHLPNGNTTIKASITAQLKPTPFYDNYLAELIQLGNKSVQGKILISIHKDSCTKKQLLQRDKVILYGELNEIHKPLNPYQFNYNNYMKHKLVFKQVIVPWEYTIIKSNELPKLQRLAYHLQEKTHHSLTKNGFSPTQVALMEAMCLGQKQYLSNELYNQFANAGIVHILAVSGLHVGIILWFLSLLFKPFAHFRWGKTLSGVCIVLCLWGYAFIAGFSPSVLRAVTMFSFISFGLFFKRKQHVLNMLLLSAVVLLGLNPYFIFDLGFQLSYSAVFSIVVFQPRLHSLIHTKHKIINYVWNIISVTLVAQLGVLPLTLYYFHQFTFAFLLTNLIVIPLLGLLLGMGFLIIIFSLFIQLPNFIIVIYGNFLDGIVFISEWVSSKETWILESIYFSFSMLFLAYLVKLLLTFSLYSGKKRFIFLLILSILVFQGNYIYEHLVKNKGEVFYIFHKSRHTLMGHKKQGTFNMIADSSLTQKAIKESKILKGIRTHEAIKTTNIVSTIQSVYSIRENYLLVIDNYGVYQTGKFCPSYILLRNSAKVNLERLLNKLQPELVIADGSNYTSYIRRWEKTCEEKKVPFHYTGKKGAFLINY